MIDPHVHLRDWKQSNKETIKHGLQVAHEAGLGAVFEMPNTDPPLMNRKNIERRIKLADKAIAELGIKIFHGLYAGITANPKQIKEIAKAHQDLFPRVVGLKMYAGHSTGELGIIEKEKQKLVYQTLAKLKYSGVLAVHCEKESLLKPKLWEPKKPFTHTQARPPKAEVESIKDQIKFAKQAGFNGILHIVHISTSESLDAIEKARRCGGFKITCAITPHHSLLNAEMMKRKNGILLKVNPPLRSKSTQKKMLRALLDGRVDWIETDHAPHQLAEKNNLPYAGGIPGFPIYPYFIKFLMEKKISQNLLKKITHNNIVKTFGIKIANANKKHEYDLGKEYEVDVCNLKFFNF